MRNAQERQQNIIHLLEHSSHPVSGGELSTTYHVSRQIIIKDIHAIREQGYDILSTARGYILQQKPGYTKIFKVIHTDEETEEELNLMVDLGGEVEDVFIYHKVYNELHAPLNIRSRKDVQDFCEAVRSGKSSLLMNATSGYHYHTVRARDRQTLKLIEDALWKRGFLAKLQKYEPDEMKKEIEQNN